MIIYNNMYGMDNREGLNILLTMLTLRHKPMTGQICQMARYCMFDCNILYANMSVYLISR